MRTTLTALPLDRKSFTEGTHRTRSPERTFERIRSMLPLFGITRLADVTGLDTVNIPVYMCVRPNAKSLSVSQGKGLHRMHAKVSAAMESIELFHAENLVLPRRQGSYRAVRERHLALNPRTLARYPNGYYHDDLPLSWVPATDIARDTQVLVPSELVGCDFVHREHRSPPGFVSSSNGLASGNCYAEAASHAICELLERDATGVFVQRGHFTEEAIGRYLIDLESVSDPHCRRLIELIRVAGLDLYAWNETCELGVPVIGCALVDTRAKVRSAVYCGGHGCHLDKSIALSRAITEAAQSRLTTITGSRDDLRRSHYQLSHCEHIRHASVRVFSAIRPTVDFDSLPSLATDSVRGDLDCLVGRLADRGYQSVAIADLTRPEFGIAVVKAIVPGLADFGDGLNLARSNLRQRAA